MSLMHDAVIVDERIPRVGVFVPLTRREDLPLHFGPDIDSLKTLKCWWRPKPSSSMHAATSCVTQIPSFHSQDVRCCSPSHAPWVKRGPEMYRETCSWRGHSEQRSLTNRIALV